MAQSKQAIRQGGPVGKVHSAVGLRMPLPGCQDSLVSDGHHALQRGFALLLGLIGLAPLTARS